MTVTRLLAFFNILFSKLFTMRRLYEWICTFIALYSIAFGFFNWNNISSSKPSSFSKPSFKNKNSSNNGFYDRIVFVVIDALRADMLYASQNTISIHPLSSSMPFLQRLLDTQEALGYIAHAQTPTGRNHQKKNIDT